MVFGTILSRGVPVLLICTSAFAGALQRETKIRIDAVPSEYTPTAGPEYPEPVSMADYSFEVDTATNRVRIVVRYTYPDQQIFASDGGVGPRPTKARVPGLKYDPESKTVIYQANGKTTVCGNLETRKSLLRTINVVQPTGLCVVSSELTKSSVDDGFNIRRFRVLETYFEVH
jgi:hypothetical protein